MHPILKLLTISFTLLTLWMLYEALHVLVWPKLKKRIQAHRKALAAIRLHEANQLANKLKAKEKNEKTLLANKVQEVEVEEVTGDVPLVWQNVKYNTKKTQHIVLEINGRNVNKRIEKLHS